MYKYKMCSSSTCIVVVFKVFKFSFRLVTQINSKTVVKRKVKYSECYYCLYI